MSGKQVLDDHLTTKQCVYAYDQLASRGGANFVPRRRGLVVLGPARGLCATPQDSWVPRRKQKSSSPGPRV